MKEYVVRPFDLPEFARKRAEDKGVIQAVIINREYVGHEARGWNWRGTSWHDGADYWTYRELPNTPDRRFSALPADHPAEPQP